MHREISLKNTALFLKIKEIANPSKFKIVELTQNKSYNITELSKKVPLAFNKCSNYCTELQKMDLIEKKEENNNVKIKSKLVLAKLSQLL